ncbi:hypothetical protein RG931_000190 [Pseudomonas syringae pv. actinidiae]|uniref:Uncharacterized protein n=1 Tax=Pseudomonas syringae group genomosp. 3 TaxID=251701 RepID=A0A2K4W6L0_9PSED|nr:hypothetical protein BV361_00190 [Pseudomonas syringae pv. actinidiae]OSR78689.1 hypothetical protein BV327_00772 [Pseudomonas syringae pv. actinidiae]BBM09419.1 hypothetical protein KPSA3_103146 [Pseudomonas syringae pv. actinidiae]SOS31535.1 hypothetical protein CFBP6411_00165 [Pseudomonas syringae group genomosp. 3]SPF10583.1 hypothetical protein PSCFBP3800_00512 [Pseudomonas syringae group genomosp. 3]
MLRAKTYYLSDEPGINHDGFRKGLGSVQF